VRTIAVAARDPGRDDVTVADQDECVARPDSSVDPEDLHEGRTGREDRRVLWLGGEPMVSREEVHSPQATAYVGAIHRSYKERLELQLIADGQLSGECIPVVRRHGGEDDEDVIPVARDQLADVDLATIDGVHAGQRLAEDPEGRGGREVEEAESRLGGGERGRVRTRVRGGRGEGHFGHEERLQLRGGMCFSVSESWNENTSASLPCGGDPVNGDGVDGQRNSYGKISQICLITPLSLLEEDLQVCIRRGL